MLCLHLETEFFKSEGPGRTCSGRCKVQIGILFKRYIPIGTYMELCVGVQTALLRPISMSYNRKIGIVDHITHRTIQIQ